MSGPAPKQVSAMHKLFFVLALVMGVLPCTGLLAQGAAARDAGGTGKGLIELWAAGQPAFGYYVRQAREEGDTAEHPVYTVQTGRELAANPLPDFAFLSLEQHYDAASARNIAEGLHSGGVNRDMALLVRIPPISEDGVEAARARTREVLELGADGVVIPHVLSLEEAREAVSFFDGVDVWSPANPDGSVVVMLIVEDPDVFSELDEIARIPGYSSLVCGIGSLTQALDGDREAAEKINLQVLEASRRAGLVDMITVSTESVALRLEQGFLGLLAYGPEANDAIRAGRAAAAQ
jgi:2-keto-3-deoxy-L-rhamnonate aldolase RhmA